jgi:hypothetical protein
VAFWKLEAIWLERVSTAHLVHQPQHSRAI